jgi:catechol 2,3-dioxygenase-like lactoylglutathione lyase family enzyme
VEFFVGIPVTSIDSSLDWYTRLLGRGPDLRDGDHAAIWDLAEGRSLFIESKPESIGHMLFTMYFNDLDAEIARIGSRGIEPTEAHSSDDLRIFSFVDPDGNEIDFGWYPH